ncbi:HD domain-containing protein [Kamptonema cortianum]|nr:HD domain-containing protein [Geitlerinema splendidum]MDK3156354.1 HD domain-containing protein [Kamptonema cortianum]
MASIRESREHLLDELRTSPSGLRFCEAHTKIADEVWQGLHNEMLARFPDLPPIALLATGGYGRREVCTHSDLDLTVVPAEESHELAEGVRWLFREADQAFRVTLGLKVSYVYRLISDVPGLDSVTLTNLLDLRLVAGSEVIRRRVADELWKDFPVAEFILAKIHERQDETRNSHATPLVVEPHLKFGAGGLRDFQVFNWIGIAIGERERNPDEDIDFILLARNLMHLVSGRMNDLVTPGRREEIAKLAGMESAEFGSKLAEAMLVNHERFLDGLNRITESRFSLGRGATAVRGQVRIEPGTTASQAAQSIAVATKLGLEIAHETAPVSSICSPDVMAALLQGEEVIRNLDKSKILEVVLPELTRCRFLMPEDAAHRFTVFEHTLQAVRNFDTIGEGHPLEQIKLMLVDKESLVLALLLHDVGKIEGAENHGELGADMAAEVCRRWRLDPHMGEFVTWLVREHLSMSRLLRMRDVMHAETAADFARHVQSLDKLHALTLLTYCDVNAVSPQLWTPMQETFLLELHSRTMMLLQSEGNHLPDESAAQRRIRRSLKQEEASDDEIERFISSLPPHYLLSTSVESAREDFRMHNLALRGQTVVTYKDYPDLNVTDLTVCRLDSPGALTKLLAVLYAFDVSLIGLRASTTASETPVLLDMFTVAVNNQPISERLRGRLEERIVEAMEGTLDTDEFLESRGKSPYRRQEFFEVKLSGADQSILEFRAPRGRGLAFRLARQIAEQGWIIYAARVGQWAGSASAAFYVRGTDGRPVSESEVLRAFSQSE